MTADDAKGAANCRTPGGDQLRTALRTALDRFIDPDDDTMPALNRVDGGFTWVTTDSVLDDLMKVVEPLACMYLQAMADLGAALDAIDRVRRIPSYQSPVHGDRGRGMQMGWDAALEAVHAALAGTSDHTETA